MAQGAFEFGHEKARSGPDLAFLVFCAFLVVVLVARMAEPVLAFVSPQSPVVPPGDKTPSYLARPAEAVPDADPGALGSVWRVRAGGGLIVLGVVLVFGGLLAITRREASTTLAPPDEPGERVL